MGNCFKLQGFLSEELLKLIFLHFVILYFLYAFVKLGPQ
jgi:hypothetical protein